MNKIYGIVIIGLLVFGCTVRKTENDSVLEKIGFDQNLADELKRMAKIDQIAAYIPQGKYKEMTSEQWDSFKDSVFTTHQIRIEEIFDKHGFVGYDLAGAEGSSNFWLMVQHSDHNPDFQKEVLEKMKIEVDKKNADSRNYGLLVDRVNLNNGQPQIYGTQVSYNVEICQAFSRTLFDSINVNKRRMEIGLQPLEEYLNAMTLMHFDMNKEFYAKKGVTEPKLYKVE
jgi:hypothetical protein